MAATASTTRKRKSTTTRKKRAPRKTTPAAPVEAPVEVAVPVTNGVDHKAAELDARERALLEREAALATKEAVAEAVAAATAEPPVEETKAPVVLRRVQYRSRKAANLQIGRRPIERMTMRGGRATSYMDTPPAFQFKDHNLILFNQEDIDELDSKLANDSWLKNQAYKVTDTMTNLLAMRHGKVVDAVAMKEEKDVRTPAEATQRAMDENDFPVVELQKLGKGSQRQEFIVEWFAKYKRVVFPELMGVQD